MTGEERKRVVEIITRRVCRGMGRCPSSRRARDCEFTCGSVASCTAERICDALEGEGFLIVPPADGR